MNVKYTVTLVAAACAAATSLAAWRGPQAPATPDQMVAALKQNLATSQKRLRDYEWVETTVVSLKGEEKSRKQQRAYYGVDGTLTKVPVGEPQEKAAAGGGGRRAGRLKERVVENKKSEIQEYMERAVILIHRYVPPDAGRIQQAKDAGQMQMHPQAAGKVRVEFKDFLQPSDLLAIEVDATAAVPSALSVATYLEKPEDKVMLAVLFATLPDGSSYAARTTLDATAKKVRVVVENSGYRPLH